METSIPSWYVERRRPFPITKVEFGCLGIYLFPVEDLEQGQVGYSAAPDGSVLSRHDKGAWQPNWIAIGCETGLGDPIIMDTSEAGHPVFTAMHGENTWKPNQISISLNSFLDSVTEFSRIAKGRSNPVELKANPLDNLSRFEYLDKVSALNNGHLAEFWEVLLAG